MLMKDIMKEKGLVDDNTVSIECPWCHSAGLSFPDLLTVISPLFHDSNCLYTRTLFQMGFNPFDLKDEKVFNLMKNEFIIKKLFE
jgi:hypothetical protein